MVHGYHVILPTYGFWLPNDPRGSWSDFVRKWEMLRFGETTKRDDRRMLVELTPDELTERDSARRSLKYPPVTLTGRQALVVARGFERRVKQSNYTIWACSILPEHTHLVIARHTYKIEQMCNLLKGSATAQLIKEGCHPLAAHVGPNKRPPRMWAEHEWAVYLDKDTALTNAIKYVVANPLKEGKPIQNWGFVTPYEGIAPGGWLTYH